jgi:hypothetical protein
MEIATPRPTATTTAASAFKPTLRCRIATIGRPSPSSLASARASRRSSRPIPARLSPRTVGGARPTADGWPRHTHACTHRRGGRHEGTADCPGRRNLPRARRATAADLTFAAQQPTPAPWCSTMPASFRPGARRDDQAAARGARGDQPADRPRTSSPSTGWYRRNTGSRCFGSTGRGPASRVDLTSPCDYDERRRRVRVAGGDDQDAQAAVGRAAPGARPLSADVSARCSPGWRPAVLKNPRLAGSFSPTWGALPLENAGVAARFPAGFIGLAWRREGPAPIALE